MKRYLAVALGAALCGCAGMLPAPTPMRSVDHAAASQPAKCLFVLLPGAGDRAETFEQRGFVEALRSRPLSIDVRASDATLGYYMRGIVLDRLAADVLAPEKTRGYQETWLVGPSMGGFGSLFYARAHTADITGVLAIAPFLGDRELIKEISDVGGLDKWQAPPRVEVMDRDNYQREMWRWFQATTRGQEPAPLLFLGYGTSDSLGTAAQLLTAKLPPSRVFLTEGGHEWPAWRRVLEQFLDSPDFATHCRVEASALSPPTR
jgi:pimeloyl-ACP methyl ester carboxylesterase